MLGCAPYADCERFPGVISRNRGLFRRSVGDICLIRRSVGDIRLVRRSVGEICPGRMFESKGGGTPREKLRICDLHGVASGVRGTLELKRVRSEPLRFKLWLFGVFGALLSLSLMLFLAESEIWFLYSDCEDTGFSVFCCGVYFGDGYLEAPVVPWSSADADLF